ncbi:MAG: YhdT family protein [Lachnospiraceae bacterium]|nr:YhdT family protein [Lachnospiraceae bacterium]
MLKLTDEEKHKQMLKEIKATFVLILIVAAWHIGFGFGLNGIDIMILGMPLWFFVSTIGAFVISVVGVIILLKFVFVNFELGDEMDEESLSDIDNQTTSGKEVALDE